MLTVGPHDGTGKRERKSQRSVYMTARLLELTTSLSGRDLRDADAAVFRCARSPIEVPARARNPALSVHRGSHPVSCGRGRRCFTRERDY